MEVKKLSTFTATELEILLTTNISLKGKMQVIVSDLANVFVNEMIESTDAYVVFNISSGKLYYSPTGLHTNHDIISYIYDSINSFDNVNIVVDYVDVIKREVNDWMRSEEDNASPDFLDVKAEIARQTFITTMNHTLKAYDINEIRKVQNYSLCNKAISLSEWAEAHLDREFVIDIKTGNMYESVHE